jgi:hypothetical protein
MKNRKQLCSVWTRAWGDNALQQTQAAGSRLDAGSQIMFVSVHHVPPAAPEGEAGYRCHRHERVLCVSISQGAAAFVGEAGSRQL